MLMAILAWVGSRAKWERFGEGLASAVALGSFVGFFWVTPRFWLTPSEIVAYSKIPYPEREVTPTTEISPTLDFHLGSPTTFEVGLKREKTLGPGALVMHDQSYGNFVALFWNNDYSNNIGYELYSPSFVKHAEAMGAIWIFASHGDQLYRDLTKKDSGWEELGTLSVERWGVIFRRTRW
jgi:hypothetical protein